MQPAQSCPPAPAEDVAVDKILSLLADDYTQSILSALTAGAKTADEIADDCPASTVTIYRRLNRLETVGLVATGTRLTADGTHRTQYRARPASVAVSISEEGLTGEFTLAAPPEVGDGEYGHHLALTVGDD